MIKPLKLNGPEQFPPLNMHKFAESILFGDAGTRRERSEDAKVDKFLKHRPKVIRPGHDGHIECNSIDCIL